MDSGDTAWILTSSCYGAIWLKNKLRLDDSLDVWAVHCIGSTWGMLATGLFVGVGLVGLGYSDFALDGINRGEQILRQLGAIGVAWGWAFSTTLVILLALKFTIGLRVKESEGRRGRTGARHFSARGEGVRELVCIGRPE